MDRSQQTRMLGSFALAATVAMGVAAAWGYVASWGHNRLDDWVFHSLNESLEITRDGRALIRHVARVDGTWVSTYRTPNGQEVTDPVAVTAALVSLSPPTIRPGRLPWSMRVLGFSDTRTVAAEWYLIRDRVSPGQAYFEIYDCQTRERLGYFGRQGFRSDLPPGDEQFANVPSNGCDALPIAFEDYGWAQWQRASAIYLIADGKLWRIDLEKRSLQAIEIDGEPVSTALATEIPPTGDAGSFVYQIVVRTSDSLVFLGAAGAAERTLSIPDDMRSRPFNVCRTASDEVVVTSTWPYDDIDVYWLGDKDGATRHENVHLAGMRPLLFHSDYSSWFTFTVFPSPLLQALVYPFYAYVMATAGDEPLNISEALGQLVSRDWPAIMSLCILSAMLAAMCYRHHSRYADRGGAAWALFVLVMGVPGAIGYWLHRAWPARERCAHCGAEVPRDRDGCLVCAERFASPAPLGIEVFA